MRGAVRALAPERKPIAPSTKKPPSLRPVAVIGPTGRVQLVEHPTIEQVYPLHEQRLPSSRRADQAEGMTETESKWVERVRQWRESGQTASVFSQGKGFEPSTLRFWASQLKRRGPSPDPRAPRMLRVRRTRESSAEPLVVRVGEARVEVRAGFDTALLRAVVASLSWTEEA